ncbi:hypothetical protein Anapl_09957 [Anas platyrhynchos]|uniref:Uncharacterized protein n=1 Tax=Anas platyrhynchos TaxID=8839 RepID=R0LJV3_ANAPL|nr:hypothetical protein Anapl_09957 [Anas platyrhynchos]
MPFPADSRIKPPIVCLHLKPSPWQAAAGSCRGRGSPWEGALKCRTPPMTSPVPQHLPAVTAPTHPDFHLQMFIMLLPTCFSSRPPAPELIHLKIIKLYEFCCRAKPCHPTRSQLNGSIDAELLLICNAATAMPATLSVLRFYQQASAPNLPVRSSVRGRLPVLAAAEAAVLQDLLVRGLGGQPQTQPQPQTQRQQQWQAQLQLMDLEPAEKGRGLILLSPIAPASITCATGNSWDLSPGSSHGSVREALGVGTELCTVTSCSAMRRARKLISIKRHETLPRPQSTASICGFYRLKDDEELFLGRARMLHHEPSSNTSSQKLLEGTQTCTVLELLCLHQPCTVLEGSQAAPQVPQQQGTASQLQVPVGFMTRTSSSAIRSLLGSGQDAAGN